MMRISFFRLAVRTRIHIISHFHIGNFACVKAYLYINVVLMIWPRFKELFFFIRLPPEFLPMLGLLTRWCASTLGAALVCSSKAGSDFGACIQMSWGLCQLGSTPQVGTRCGPRRGNSLGLIPVLFTPQINSSNKSTLASPLASAYSFEIPSLRLLWYRIEQRFPTAGTRPGTGTWNRFRWDPEFHFNKPGYSNCKHV